MNLNNSLRRVPLVGTALNSVLAGGERKRGVKLAVRVAANAVTIYAGPYALDIYPGGRGVDRFEHHVRGEGDWFRSLSRTVRGRYVRVVLDRNPRWKVNYR